MSKPKLKNLIGIIPAAGKGSRLQPYPCPKELFPVGYQDYMVNGVEQKRPKVVSQYLIENILKAGVSRLFIILGEGKSQIMEYFGNGLRFGVDISYLFQEELSGMPSALNLVYPWDKNSTVLFGMPDTIIEPHDLFEKLLEFHEQNSSDLTLGLFPTNTPSKFGMTATDEDGNVLYTLDKPLKTDLTHAWGCACWSKEFSYLLNEFLDEKHEFDKEIVLGDVFNYAIEKKLTVKALKLDDAKYIDIGTSDELDAALKKFHL